MFIVHHSLQITLKLSILFVPVNTVREIMQRWHHSVILYMRDLEVTDLVCVRVRSRTQVTGVIPEFSRRWLIKCCEKTIIK